MVKRLMEPFILNCRIRTMKVAAYILAFFESAKTLEIACVY